MRWNHTTRSMLALLGAVSFGSTAALSASAATHALLVGSQGNGRIIRYDGQTGDPVNLFVPPGSGGVGLWLLGRSAGNDCGP